MFSSAQMWCLPLPAKWPSLSLQRHASCNFAHASEGWIILSLLPIAEVAGKGRKVGCESEWEASESRKCTPIVCSGWRGAAFGFTLCIGGLPGLASASLCKLTQKPHFIPQGLLRSHEHRKLVSAKGNCFVWTELLSNPSLCKKGGSWSELQFLRHLVEPEIVSMVMSRIAFPAHPVQVYELLALQGSIWMFLLQADPGAAQSNCNRPTQEVRRGLWPSQYANPRVTLPVQTFKMVWVTTLATYISRMQTLSHSWLR